MSRTPRVLSSTEPAALFFTLDALHVIRENELLSTCGNALQLWATGASGTLGSRRSYVWNTHGPNGISALASVPERQTFAWAPRVLEPIIFVQRSKAQDHVVTVAKLTGGTSIEYAALALSSDVKRVVGLGAVGDTALHVWDVGAGAQLAWADDKDLAMAATDDAVRRPALPGPCTFASICPHSIDDLCTGGAQGMWFWRLHRELDEYSFVVVRAAVPTDAAAAAAAATAATPSSPHPHAAAADDADGNGATEPMLLTRKDTESLPPVRPEEHFVAHCWAQARRVDVGAPQVYAINALGRLYCFDASRGDCLWTRSFRAGAHAMALSRRYLVVATGTGDLEWLALADARREDGRRGPMLEQDPIQVKGINALAGASEPFAVLEDSGDGGGGGSGDNVEAGVETPASDSAAVDDTAAGSSDSTAAAAAAVAGATVTRLAFSPSRKLLYAATKDGRLLRLEAVPPDEDEDEDEGDGVEEANAAEEEEDDSPYLRWDPAVQVLATQPPAAEPIAAVVALNDPFVAAVGARWVHIFNYKTRALAWRGCLRDAAAAFTCAASVPVAAEEGTSATLILGTESGHLHFFLVDGKGEARRMHSERWHHSAVASLLVDPSRLLLASVSRPRPLPKRTVPRDPRRGRQAFSLVRRRARAGSADRRRASPLTVMVPSTMTKPSTDASADQTVANIGAGTDAHGSSGSGVLSRCGCELLLISMRHATGPRLMGYRVLPSFFNVTTMAWHRHPPPHSARDDDDDDDDDDLLAVACADPERSVLYFHIPNDSTSIADGPAPAPAPAPGGSKKRRRQAKPLAVSMRRVPRCSVAAMLTVPSTGSVLLASPMRKEVEHREVLRSSQKNEQPDHHVAAVEAVPLANPECSRALGELRGHHTGVRCLAIAPLTGGGCVLASGDGFGYIGLWHVPAGHSTSPVSPSGMQVAHAGPVTSCAFAQNASRLFSAGRDGVVFVRSLRGPISTDAAEAAVARAKALPDKNPVEQWTGGGKARGRRAQKMKLLAKSEGAGPTTPSPSTSSSSSSAISVTTPAAASLLAPTRIAKCLEAEHAAVEEVNAAAREEMQQRVDELKARLMVLLDANAAVPEVEKMDRLEFVIDHAGKARAAQRNARAAAELARRMQLSIHGNELVAQRMKAEFWDPQDVEVRGLGVVQSAIVCAFELTAAEASSLTVHTSTSGAAPTPRRARARQHAKSDPSAGAGAALLSVSNFPLRFIAPESSTRTERILRLREMEVREVFAREEAAEAALERRMSLSSLDDGGGGDGGSAEGDGDGDDDDTGDEKSGGAAAAGGAAAGDGRGEGHPPRAAVPDDIAWMLNAGRLREEVMRYVGAVQDSDFGGAAADGERERDARSLAALLYDPVTIQTERQKRAQVVLLQVLIRRVKEAFNAEFDALADKKRQEMGRIKSKNERIVEILNLVREAGKQKQQAKDAIAAEKKLAEAHKRKPMSWRTLPGEDDDDGKAAAAAAAAKRAKVQINTTAREHNDDVTYFVPELQPGEEPAQIIAVHPDEVGFERYISAAERAEQAEREAEIARRAAAAAENDGPERALDDMMHGTLEQQDAMAALEAAANNILKRPEWMDEISSDEWTPEHKEQAQERAAMLKEFAAERETQVKVLGQELRKIKAEVADATALFDDLVRSLRLKKLKGDVMVRQQEAYLLALVRQVGQKEVAIAQVRTAIARFHVAVARQRQAAAHEASLAGPRAAQQVAVAQAEDQDEALSWKNVGRREFTQFDNMEVAGHKALGAIFKQRRAGLDWGNGSRSGRRRRNRGGASHSHSGSQSSLRSSRSRTSHNTSGGHGRGGVFRRNMSGASILSTDPRPTRPDGRRGSWRGGSTRPTWSGMRLRTSAISAFGRALQRRRHGAAGRTAKELAQRLRLAQADHLLKELHVILGPETPHAMSCFLDADARRRVEERHALAKLEPDEAVRPDDFAVEPAVWTRLTELRLDKIKTEINLHKAADALAKVQAKVDAATARRERAAMAVAAARADVGRAQRRKARRDCDSVVAVVLKQGQGELPGHEDVGAVFDARQDDEDEDEDDDIEARRRREDSQEAGQEGLATMIPRRDIVKLNRLVRRGGREVIEVMERIRAFKRKLNLNEWHRLYLDAKQDSLEGACTDFKMLRVTKDMQDFIRGSGRIQTDEVKQAKIEAKSAHLDTALERKTAETTNKAQRIRGKIAVMDGRNARLRDRAEQLAETVTKRARVLAGRTAQPDPQDLARDRVDRILSRRRLVDRVRAQAEELDFLRDELDRLHQRTYPSFPSRASQHQHQRQGSKQQQLEEQGGDASLPYL